MGGGGLRVTETLAIVTASLNLLAPAAVIDIPADRLAQSGFERVSRPPRELACDLRRVDRVAPIVARTIRHERLEPAARTGGRLQVVDDVANRVDDLEVRPFVAAADVVLL